MAFQHEQQIGRYKYVYEVESYWDKEKKQSRQRRTYLGRRDPKTGQVVPTRGTTVPRGFKDYGNIYLLDSLAGKIGLKDCLRQIYEGLWKEIITCAYFEISEAKALYLCQPWVELTYSEGLAEGLSSQRISELLQEIGESLQKRSDFFHQWIATQQETKSVFYDITSLSTYSKTIDLAEWGYNRDKERLPQINLGVVYGEPLSLPLFYRVHSGSIPDVSTLKNTLQFSQYVGLKAVRFVMDRGFFSKYNLKQMSKSSMKFLIPYPETNKGALELIRRHTTDIASPMNAFRVNDSILHGVKDRVQIGENSYQAFIYLDEKKKTDESERFFKELIEAEERVSEIGFVSKEETEGFLSDNFRRWKKYMLVVKSADRYTLRRKKKEIEQAIERMGKLLLITNNRIDLRDAIALYRKKDIIEKFFDNLKNELKGKRLRVHTAEALEGRIFLSFVSLILYSWINKVMREKNLYKDFTLQEIIYELKKIKLIQLDKKRPFITEVTKKQRQIFEIFEVDPPETSL